tara:strand:- start:52 stop:180 length:129 start_codon:yes stop_codon:yes gene_type:complete
MDGSTTGSEDPPSDDERAMSAKKRTALSMTAVLFLERLRLER